MSRALRDPRVFVLAATAAAIAVGFTWGLPNTATWAADAISPRSCGLGAIAETYTPGHFHTYPPLHMAILTVLSLPWIAVAAARVGTGADALAAELIHPLTMTGIEVSARLVSAAMALATVWNLMKLWERLSGRRAALLAGCVLSTNSVLVYYAHTGNLDVPYLFWIAWALLELDRVACGEPRERRALLLCVAAALTKDQAGPALVLPVVASVFLLPRVFRGAKLARPAVLRAGAVALVVYAVVSGAAVNPTGFARRVAFLVGPASQSWAEYPRTLPGLLALARDTVLAVPRVASWPIFVAACGGVVLVFTTMRGLPRLRALLPLLAAVSFAVFFGVGARRTDDRFLLPQAVFFFPYAAVAFDRALSTWPRRRAVVASVFAVALAPAALAVASLDATLLVDSRYEVERYLASLPEGARVEVYGGVLFMPRIPARLHAVRPGVEPLGDRQAIAFVTDVVDPALDPRARDPDVIVLATELSNDAMASGSAGGAQPFALMSYRDPASRRFLAGLSSGALGYARTLRAGCSLPWPLACREIHHSTAGEAWVYTRRGYSTVVGAGASATSPSPLLP